MLVAIVPFFDALFLDRSILSFDTRAFPPFSIEAPPDLGSRPGNFVTSDLNGWIVPEAALTAAEIRAGRLPLWNPFTLCGQPLLANLAFPAFYPPNLIALAFGPEHLLRAIAWVAVLHLALAAIGAYLFLRGHGLSRPSALLGAVGVGFATWLTTRLHLPSIAATAAWFFAILLGVDRVLRAPDRRAVAALAVAIGMAALAGFPQLLAVELLGAALYAVLRWCERGRIRRAGPLLGLCAGAALGVAAGAVHLLPAVDRLDDSLRSAFVTPERQAETALRPAAFFGFVLPEFFAPAVEPHDRFGARERDYAQLRWLGTGTSENPVENALSPGSALLVLALACGFAWRRRPTVALTSLALVGLGLGVFGPWLTGLHAALPWLSAASPKRVIALFTLTLPVLIALGVEEAVRGGNGFVRLRRVGFAVALLAGAGGLAARIGPTSDPALAEFLDRVAGGAFLLAAIAAAIALSPAAIGTLAKRIGSERAFAAAIVLFAALAAIELGFRARRFNPTQDLSGQYPVTPAIEFLRAEGARGVRFENVEGAAATLGSLLGYRSFDGAQPMVATRFGEFVESIEPGRFDRDDPRLMRPFSRVESLSHPAFLRAAVEHVVVTRPVPEAGLEIAYANEAEGIGVYRQQNALPRVRLVGGYELVAATDERLARLADPALDPRAVVLLEVSPGDEIPRGPAPASGRAVIASESATEWTIDLQGVDAPALLYVADTYVEGWHAEVDGRAAPVLAADHAFRAIPVPAGARTVTLRYRPAAFRYGAAISLAALVCLVLLPLRTRGRHAAKPALDPTS